MLLEKLNSVTDQPDGASSLPTEEANERLDTQHLTGTIIITYTCSVVESDTELNQSSKKAKKQTGAKRAAGKKR